MHEGMDENDGDEKAEAADTNLPVLPSPLESDCDDLEEKADDDLDDLGKPKEGQHEAASKE